MFNKLIYSKPVIIVRITWAFVQLICLSLYMNVFNCNTRQATNAAAKRFGDRLFRAAGSPVTLKGALPDFNDGRPYIIISNHTSHYDIPAVFATVPASVRMVGKKELFKIPFFGSAMLRHEFVCIDRQNRESALKSLKQARDLMQSGIVIWIAAEGTRTRTGTLQPFKKGVFMLAIDTQAVIVPMMIEGANQLLPPDGLHFNPHTPVTVHVGECVDTQGMTEANRDALMAKVRGVMESLV